MSILQVNYMRNNLQISVDNVDKVSFKVLFDLLLDKNVCPKIVQLLYFMYTNQLCHVKWGGEKSASFLISNGVKQGGVISPLLFSLYVDELFLLLKKVWFGLSCWVNICRSIWIRR